MTGYKIIEIDKFGKSKFMFCGLNGSRTIKMDKWLDAEQKIVSDSNSKTYMSGFHVLDEDLSAVATYAKRFKNKEGKYVVRVEFEDYRNKPTKGSLAILANRIKFDSASVTHAIPLESL